MQHFRSIKDVKDLNALLQKAKEMKKNPLAHQHLGKGKTMVLLFFNPSLRTRLSTEKAARNLGMEVITMNAGQGWQLEFEDGKKMDGTKAEHVKEAARVISQYADIIGVRTFPTLTDRKKDYQEFILNQFVKYASVPIVNMESATVHPLQSLTDLLTIKEHQKNVRPKVVLTWAPHPKALPQAVANSFVEWMKAANMDLTITHPKGYELAPIFSENIKVEYNQKKAFENADFIYAKNWSPYYDYGKILDNNSDWIITADKMELTNKGCFMHCLPVRRNVVVMDDVLDHENSLIIKQVVNREYAAQAILCDMLLGL